MNIRYRSNFRGHNEFIISVRAVQVPFSEWNVSESHLLDLHIYPLMALFSNNECRSILKFAFLHDATMPAIVGASNRKWTNYVARKSADRVLFSPSLKTKSHDAHRQLQSLLFL
jgi:hypothetical protein